VREWAGPVGTLRPGGHFEPLAAPQTLTVDAPAGPAAAAAGGSAAAAAAAAAAAGKLWVGAGGIDAVPRLLTEGVRVCGDTWVARVERPAGPGGAGAGGKWRLFRDASGTKVRAGGPAGRRAG
jgi:hypothetical protein